MMPLSTQQKELIFEYCTGLTSEEQTAQIEELIASNDEASTIYSNLQCVFSPLEALQPHVCPDDLAERTILRLNNVARSSQLQLEQLLTDEQARSVESDGRRWLSFGRRLANAAIFMIVGIVLISTFNLMRYKYAQFNEQFKCQGRLARIGQGIASYAADHDGTMPLMANTMGTPWWKIGYQGKENHSNTRPVWQLVKEGYVDQSDFMCPGRKTRRVVKLTPAQIRRLSDFPNRGYITYSLRIKCNSSTGQCLLSQKALMADLNPVFESLLPSYSNPLEVQLNKDLLTRNSTSHNHRGQNLLFGDGHARFVKGRRLGITEDDIYTLQNTEVYQGSEVPSSEDDTFLAP